jgi:hypothetical protein
MSNLSPEFINGMIAGGMIVLGLVLAGVALTLTWIAMTRFLAAAKTDVHPLPCTTCHESSCDCCQLVMNPRN